MLRPAACCVVLASLAAGCGPAAVRHDIAFMRGCWVEKIEPGGTITAFLRLLPDREGAETLTGILDYIDPDMGDGVSDDGRDDMIYTLATDGSMLTTQVARESGHQNQSTQENTPPVEWRAVQIPTVAEEQRLEGETLASFQEQHFQSTILVGRPDSLAIYTLTPDGQLGTTLFDGERDGCD